MSIKNSGGIGINLTGGGARGSYQAGVLLAIGEILKENRLLGKRNPIRYITGVSAGAINAAVCASGMNDLYTTSQKLVDVWTKIKPSDVYKTDVLSLGKNSAKWVRDLTFGPIFKTKLAKALLDTEPLYGLLTKEIPFERIQYLIDRNIFDGIACSAYSYKDDKTVTFLQSKNKVSWDKIKRYSKSTQLNIHHIIASCSIPIIFPATSISGEYFADGAFRSTSPISPIIHLGATKILNVGVRTLNADSVQYNKEPSVAKMAGEIINSLFFDTIDVDLERIHHINEIITALNNDVTTSRSDYTTIDCRVVRPSENIAEISKSKSKDGLPKAIDFLMRGIGSRDETAELSSYILFESSFTTELIELGYKDMKGQKELLLDWF